MISHRSNCSQMVYNLGGPKIFLNSLGNLYGVFFNWAAGLRPASLLKRRLYSNAGVSLWGLQKKLITPVA